MNGHPYEEFLLIYSWNLYVIAAANNRKQLKICSK